MYVTCIPSGQLTLEDLSEVRGALYEACAKWYDIGIELKLSVGTLNTIKEDFPQAAECLRETCVHWLKRIDPCPTWAALTKALESPPVGEGHLLRDKYCRGREETIPHVYPTPGNYMRWGAPGCDGPPRILLAVISFSLNDGNFSSLQVLPPPHCLSP